MLVVALAHGVAGPCHAQSTGPAGEQVVAGGASISRPNGNVTRIEQTSDRAIINWDSFNISAGHTVEFDQPSSTAAALNRITNGDPTEIFGNLDANGILYLINPAGIVFGDGAVVNVAGLYAAGGHIDNSDFLNHVNRFTDIIGDVSVSVEATLTLVADPDPEALIALLGRRVEHLGVISAPSGSVALVAANQVLLGERDGHVHVRLERVDSDNTLTLIDVDFAEGEIDTPHVSLASGDFASLVAGLEQLDAGEVPPASQEVVFGSEDDITIAAGGNDDTLSQVGLEALAARGAAFELQSQKTILIEPMDNQELNLIGTPRAAFIADADHQGGGDFAMHVGEIDADSAADDGILEVTERADAIVTNGGDLVIEGHRVHAGYLVSTGEELDRTQAGGVETVEFVPRGGLGPVADGDVVVITADTELLGGQNLDLLGDVEGNDVAPGALRLAAVRTGGDIELSSATDLVGVYAVGEAVGGVDPDGEPIFVGGEAEPLLVGSNVDTTHIGAMAGRNFDLQIDADSNLIHTVRFGAGTGGGGDFAGPGGAQQDGRGNREASIGWGANQRPGSGQPEAGQLIVQGEQFAQNVIFRTGTTGAAQGWSTVTLGDIKMPDEGSFTIEALPGQARLAQNVAVDDHPVGVGDDAAGGFQIINPGGNVRIGDVDTVGGAGQTYIGRTVNIESVLDSRGGDITIEAGGTLVIDGQASPSIFKTGDGDLVFLSRGGNITISPNDTVGFRDNAPGSLVFDSATDAGPNQGDISFGGVTVPNGSFLVNASGNVTIIETSGDNTTATISALGGSPDNLAQAYASAGLAGPVTHQAVAVNQVNGVRIDTPHLFLVNAAQPPFIQSIEGRVLIHATDVTVLPTAAPKPGLAAQSLARIEVVPVIHEPKFDLGTDLRLPRAVTIDLRELIASIFDTHREEADEAEAPEGDYVELSETDNEILVLMGLVPRQIEREDVRRPPVLFRDAPHGLDEHEFRVTVHRLDATALRRALQRYRAVFLTDPENPATGRYEQIRANFEAALLAYIEEAGDYDPVAFRRHLRSRDEQTARDFGAIEQLLVSVQRMGLTPVEVANSRREMLQRITPSGLRVDELIAAFTAQPGEA
ncbi:MAG: filamentous hemagglutinin N-terminal domain-containing protein [Phycisphaeraceae bacterium]